MSRSKQTQVLEKALAKIKVPRADIAKILMNFDNLKNDIIGGVLAPEQLKDIAQHIIDDPNFRAKFISDSKGAIKLLGIPKS